MYESNRKNLHLNKKSNIMPKFLWCLSPSQKMFVPKSILSYLFHQLSCMALVNTPEDHEVFILYKGVSTISSCSKNNTKILSLKYVVK